MIQVVTTVDVRPDCLASFLSLLGENIPLVKAEQGCLAYEPMVDIDSGMPTQGANRENTVILVEAWESMDALRTHLQAPHMASFREVAKELVERVSHQVLQPL